MTPRLETITTEQRQAIRQLGAFTVERGMYLAGGTAIALHLGHRQSVDLDWFSPTPIGDPLRLAAEIRSAGAPLSTIAVADGTLHGELSSVRISILDYLYPTIEATIESPPLECRLASLDDLSAMKLSAVSQRGAKRDFVDIHALGKRTSLSHMLACYRRKFAVDDLQRLLASLVYFNDAERTPMPTVLTDIAWEQIKAEIGQWVAAE